MAFYGCALANERRVGEVPPLFFRVTPELKVTWLA